MFGRQKRSDGALIEERKGTPMTYGSVRDGESVIQDAGRNSVRGAFAEMYKRGRKVGVRSEE